MRTDLLDLDKLPDIPDEEKDRLKSAGVLDKVDYYRYDINM